LTAAALMARAGLDVCVLEQNRSIGGYLAGFSRQGFEFDTAIHWLNQCGPGGLVRRIFELIGNEPPATPPLRRIRRYRGESFDYLLTENPDEMRDSMIADFPRDTAGIRSFFAHARVLGGAFASVCREMRASQTRGLLDRCRSVLSATRAGLPFARHGMPGVERGLRHYFLSDELRRVFCTESSLISCLMPLGWAYHGDYQLPPVGGSRAMIDWLADVLRDEGGTVRSGRPVTGLVMEGDRAVGVRFTSVDDDGAEGEIGCRYVVAACDLETVLTTFVPSGMGRRNAAASVRGADLYDSALTVSLGLDVPPTSLGLGEEIVFLTRDDLPRQEHSSTDPHKTSIAVLAPSARDPSLAPEGHGTMQLYVPASIHWEDGWRTGPDGRRGEAYRALKQEYAEVLIDRVERAIAPGLAGHVELCDVSTPLTYRRYTGNFDGTIMGLRASGGNMRARLANISTPVRNMLMGGQWAGYGGGLPNAVRGGANAALIIMQKERLAGFQVVADVFDGKLDPGEGREKL